MIPEDFHADPTRLLGLLSFGLAAAACAHTAQRRQWGLVWCGLCGAQLLLFAEVLLGVRHTVHALVDTALRENALYEARAGLQVVLLLGVLTVLIGLGIATACRRRDESIAAPAIIATLGAAALLLVETISLHRLDAVMYAEVGPFLAISLAWAVCAVTVTVLALRAARR